jgi:hypothetical protein
MSEPGRAGAAQGVREIAVRSARKQGREVVRMRYVEDEGGFVIECEVYPVGAVLVEPLRPGPYRFPQREHADEFVREALAILEHFGCDVA